MANKEYKVLSKKEKVWTFESLREEYEKVKRDVLHMKKENSEYYSEAKAKDDEIKNLKADKKELKMTISTLNEEIKLLQRELKHFKK